MLDDVRMGRRRKIRMVMVVKIDPVYGFIILYILCINLTAFLNLSTSHLLHTTTTIPHTYDDTL